MKDNHLNEDQLIHSVIDSENLSHELIDHLSECSFCQEQKRSLEKDLNTVGLMAQKYTPVSKKRMRYAYEDSMRESPRLWFFNTSFAAAAIVVVILLGIWFIKPVSVNNDSQVDYLSKEVYIEQQLLAEIWEIEDKYLMGYSITTYDDSEGYSDEEFWEFLFPFEEENNSA